VLKTTQIAAITAAGIGVLTTDQVQNITTAGIAALTTAQVVALTTSDIEALQTTQLIALTTSAVQSLTTSQIEALSTTQVEAMTTSQIGALTTTQIAGHLALGTPVILDLNGDGVKTLSVSAGVNFDLFATGKSVSTGWVSGNDGLLVLDRNHDGQINDGSELFGTSTLLANGQKAGDGYAALRELDGNSDGAITSADAAYAKLQVWVDANSDGVTQSGELKSLQDLGISSISTLADVNLSKDNGNLVGLTSTYTTTDGATHAAADVWFVADRQASVVPVVAAATPVAVASPPISEAQLAATLDWNSPTAVTAPPVNQAASAPAGDLRSQVSGMAQAINSFNAGDTASTAGLPAEQIGASLPSLTVLAVGSMVDAMKQFDANGNPVGKATTLAAALPSVTGSAVLDPTQSALLALPGSKLPG
jgi:hypothetical protein